MKNLAALLGNRRDAIVLYASPAAIEAARDELRKKFEENFSYDVFRRRGELIYAMLRGGTDVLAKAEEIARARKCAEEVRARWGDSANYLNSTVLAAIEMAATLREHDERTDELDRLAKRSDFRFAVAAPPPGQGVVH